MIQMICLALLIVLVVIRGPRAVSSKFARPVWWATATGVISLSTYGFPVSFAAYDAFLGGSNVTTLVRDLAATTAFWFFRKAVALSDGSSRGRVSTRWGLVVLYASYTVPFSLIENPGPTEVDFVVNRLDQPAVWVYGTAYMCGIIWLSASAVFAARPDWRGVHAVFIAGYILVIIGCTIEVAFLTASHFGYGGHAYRYSAWDDSKLPFFIGIFLITVGIGWVAIGVPIKRRLLVGRLWRAVVRHDLVDTDTIRRGTSPALRTEKTMMACAQELAVLMVDAEHRGEFTPNTVERRTLEKVCRLFVTDEAFRPLVTNHAEEG
ncbi:hypothetical protein C5C31_09230 [Rathayibacter rathayi]|uniref:hypothetical protein n=1 Tax=Rathayibacter rathayi TaxID=33887 RepID=UPI000CE811CF|nr:hypothetical protein [Rathayibacter rathayi]PPG67573.1 hypothetical protein C5C02_09470 [Rathayibacter rathayi]PPG76560.1 hypothetical protein C5C23_07475 [Rathayibacter rathayi]PPH22248.1 hypothetical protein C5C31_09230 [Rathayibacter rathayi]PPH37000.1 hypothetical protein C5C28_04845 [Rathayibacter rathayi]PPH64290.1 hypothetical protein C5C45_12890 [Rathayibacter rathayi]